MRFQTAKSSDTANDEGKFDEIIILPLTPSILEGELTSETRIK